MTGRTTISNEANQLYHTVAREIGGGEQAIHIAWALNKNREGGYWKGGFSPESQFLGVDQKVLDYIVAGDAAKFSWSSMGRCPRRQRT